MSGGFCPGGFCPGGFCPYAAWAYFILYLSIDCYISILFVHLFLHMV